MEHSEIGFDLSDFSAYFDLSLHLVLFLFYLESTHTFSCQLGSQSVTLALGIINSALESKRMASVGDGTNI